MPCHNLNRLQWLSAAILVFAGSHLCAQEEAVYELQLRHLMMPSQQQQQLELQQQKVIIYERMKEADVDAALNDQFDRVENMMFILTRLPPAGAGGEERTLEDGCD